MTSDWYPTIGEQEEAHYLLHRGDNEVRYREWCADTGMDPEDVGSAVAFENHVAQHNEAST